MANYTITSDGLNVNTKTIPSGLSTKYKFSSRFELPAMYSKYYNTTSAGGYSPCIIGNVPKGQESGRTGIPGLNVLPNCVGYAVGRFNEIGNYGKCKYTFGGNAEDFIEHLGGLKTGLTPRLGAIMVWGQGKIGNYIKGVDGAGHVAVVEWIDETDPTRIATSESGWGYTVEANNPSTYKNAFRVITRSKGSDGNWLVGAEDWQRNGGYYFRGFIYHPDVPANSYSYQGSENEKYITPSYDLIDPRVLKAIQSIQEASSFAGAAEPEYDNNNLSWGGYRFTRDGAVSDEVTEEVEVNRARTVNYNGILNQSKSTSLLTYPTKVESPFIILKVGKFTFGNYNEERDGNKIKVTYPNFIQGMRVTKINGQLNQYEIELVYQIQKGDDPNLLDKIFGSVGYGLVSISYGDFNAPAFKYKEEEALITKLSSNVDFSSAKIKYTLYCVSTAIGLLSYSDTFPYHKSYKPSDLIFETIEKYSLDEIFTAMDSKDKILSNGWIATNDKAVEIEAQSNMDPLSYINYLVTCMIADTNGDETVLLDSSYYLTIVDDIYNSGGTYFTVKQIYSNTKTIHNQDVYEVDIGYPSESMVMSFNLVDNNSWSLLYNYNDTISKQEYVYDIDNDGNVVTNFSPSYSTSGKHYITTSPQKNWWTQVTKFPISATLTIKGLLRPAMLMSYIKVNALFYGQRHIASGLYFVTKQVDTVGKNGYRTTLNLTRFAGDEDYIATEKEEATRLVAQKTYTGAAIWDDSSLRHASLKNSFKDFWDKADDQTRATIYDMILLEGGTLPAGIEYERWPTQKKSQEDLYMDHSYNVN